MICYPHPGQALTLTHTHAQWAERLLEGGGNEQWGDKWRESFKDGAGDKTVRLGFAALAP